MPAMTYGGMPVAVFGCGKRVGPRLRLLANGHAIPVHGRFNRPIKSRKSIAAARLKNFQIRTGRMLTRSERLVTTCGREDCCDVAHVRIEDVRIERVHRPAPSFAEIKAWLAARRPPCRK